MGTRSRYSMWRRHPEPPPDILSKKLRSKLLRWRRRQISPELLFSAWMKTSAVDDPGFSVVTVDSSSGGEASINSEFTSPPEQHFVEDSRNRNDFFVSVAAEPESYADSFMKHALKTSGECSETEVSDYLPLQFVKSGSVGETTSPSYSRLLQHLNENCTKTAENFHEYSEMKHSNYAPLLFIDSGSQISKGIVRETPSPTYPLLVQYLKEFSMLRKRRTRAEGYFSTKEFEELVLQQHSQKDQWITTNEFARSEGSEEEHSYQMLRKREGKQALLRNYAEEAEFGELELHQRLQIVDWIKEIIAEGRFANKMLPSTIITHGKLATVSTKGETSNSSVRNNNNIKVILIGIVYEDFEGVFDMLPSSAIELVLIHRKLRRDYGFTAENILLLCDRVLLGLDSVLPTRENIIEHVTRLVQNSVKGDSLVLYLSAHAVIMDKPVIVTSEGDFISDDFWSGVIIRQVPVGVTLTVIVNTCYGGNFFRAASGKRVNRGEVVVFTATGELDVVQDGEFYCYALKYVLAECVGEINWTAYWKMVARLGHLNPCFFCSTKSGFDTKFLMGGKEDYPRNRYYDFFLVWTR